MGQSLHYYLSTCNRTLGSPRYPVQGRIQGGGSWGSGPPPPFGGPPNFIKREKKTLRACDRKRRVLVLNCYLDPPPPFPKSCIRPCGQGPYVSFNGVRNGLYLQNKKGDQLMIRFTSRSPTGRWGPDPRAPPPPILDPPFELECCQPSWPGLIHEASEDLSAIPFTKFSRLRSEDPPTSRPMLWGSPK